MTGRTGRPVANQTVYVAGLRETFFSYGFPIATKTKNAAGETVAIMLDVNKWDASTTTAFYRNRFLQMDTDAIKKAIQTGEIVLKDLSAEDDE